MPVHLLLIALGLAVLYHAPAIVMGHAEPVVRRCRRYYHERQSVR